MRDKKNLVDITLDGGEVITTTTEHPFFEFGSQDWINAGALAVDQHLQNNFGRVVDILSVDQYQKLVSVYNITVDNDHT